MGTTTNNGWPTPVATDLVKDGWEAIKDLGDAIDTTLGVYAPSTSGLTLINTTSFSGVTSQSINSVFTATYDSYKILVTVSTAASTSDINFRLRAAGVDLSSSSYIYGGLKVGAQTSFAFASDNNVTNTQLVLASSGSSIPSFISLDVTYPFLSNPKLVNALGAGRLGQWNNAYINSTASHDGFTILGGANLTGSISVYGYNK
jgi:hypothetical protein